MKNQPKLRNALLVAALAAVTATAWATGESLTSSDATPVVTSAERPVWNEVERTAPASSDVAVGETLEPNEAVVAAPEAAPAPTQRVSAPIEERAAQPPITVEERRLTLDERIQADVMDRIATMQNVSGKIGVESRDAVVTLTGYTATAAQATRAGREARGVSGVREVQNLIRGRVGGSA